MNRRPAAILLALLMLCTLLPAGAAADGDMPNTHTVNYSGKEYKVVLGMYDASVEAVDDISGALWPLEESQFDGQENEAPFGTFAVTVFENAGSVDKSEADAELRGQIVKSVTFGEEELSDGVDYINRIESSSGNGRWYAEPYLNRVKGEAYLTAEVTLWDGSSATLRFNIKYDVMPSDLYIDCAREGIDTQEKLQARLDGLKASLAGQKILGVYFDLMPVDYGDIKIDASGADFDIIFRGYGGYGPVSEVSQHTRLRSLTYTGGKQFVINNVVFKAGENKSTALSVDGADALDIYACSFRGYGTAVDARGVSSMGYTIDSCLFYDNGSALELDCTELRKNGGTELGVANSAFINCKSGVEITNMRADAAAYDYRIYHCDFINGNNGDRDISADRPVYASGNYLDHPADNKDSKHNADLSLRYLSPSGLAGYLLYSFGYSDTAAPAPDWGAARLGVGAEAESVTLDAADELLFPDGLLLDGASFDGRGTDLELAVQNEEGNEVGTWIFAAESEAAQ